MSWFEDEAFWARWGVALEEPDAAEAAEVARGFVDLARLPEHGRVLDVGCGHGRHALALARLGYEATALDVSARRLLRVREVSESEGLGVEIVRRDMRTFNRPRHFHGILWSGDAVGLFAEVEDEKRVLEQLYDSLKPGGRLVVAPRGKELLSRGIQTQRWHWLDGSTLILEERLVDDGWGRLRVRLTRVRHGVRAGSDQETAEAAWRLFSGTELSDLLRKVGFTKIRLFGDFHRARYDMDAKRLVAVAER